MAADEQTDYIVVGAGTAGCVVASRLAERGVRVDLFEAGGSADRLWVRIPIGYGRTFNDPAVNWMYETEPDPGLNGVRSFWPRGKVVGGSGSINAMVYARGQPQDFDDWRDAGNPGWGWADVRPVFERLEQHARLGSSGVSGTGPLRVTDVSSAVHPLCHRYLEACRQLGFALTQDFNGPQPEGVGLYQVTIRDGWRESTATAYLQPALKRANLRLRTDALVTKIEFEGRRASGVTFRQGGISHRLGASQGVILCAGSINSPQLLQISGVGPGALLQRCGVGVVQDAPAVGQHLQDHLAVSYFYRSRIRTLNNELSPWWGKLSAGLRFASGRRGPLAMSVNQGGGFVRSAPTKRAPDLQLYFNPASYAQSRERTRRLMKPDPFAAFLISFNACRPTSRGHLAIRSPSVDESPVIHPNYLSTAEDIADVVAGCRLLRRLAAAAPLAEVIEGEMLPGAAVQDDAAMVEDFRRRAGTVFHPVGTCRMGADPATTVVNSRLTVHGVDGLRVVDASVFPTVTSGNTNAPTVMVAEMGARMIAESA